MIPADSRIPLDYARASVPTPKPPSEGRLLRKQVTLALGIVMTVTAIYVSAISILVRHL